jgi:hypothetical protein
VVEVEVGQMHEEHDGLVMEVMEELLLILQ